MVGVQGIAFDGGIQRDFTLGMRLTFKLMEVRVFSDMFSLVFVLGWCIVWCLFVLC